MKKVFLWVLMVVLFVVLLVGGMVMAFYSFAGTADLPAETATLGDQKLQNNGYDWQVPVLGGVLNKPFYSAQTLTVQNLGDFGDTRPELVLPAWVGKSELELIAPDGTVALNGTAADYADYAYTQNGKYELQLTLYQTDTAKPAKPLGSYSYRAMFTVNFQPKVTLSSDTAAQGSVVAVQLAGVLDKTAPTADTDLGQVWFRATADGWMGYLPVTYNAEAGSHTISLTCGTQSFSVELSVVRKAVDSTADPDTAQTTDAAAQEYRNLVWPLYTTGSAEKLWSGSFRAPTDKGPLVKYGSPLLRDGEKSGTATGITYYAAQGDAVLAPQAGTVVLAQTLAMTGGTVVIDHGCGVKSYLYGLDTVTVQKGQKVALGDALGTAGTEHLLIYELRIGSKTVDPAAAIAGTGGLQYHENG